MLPRIPALLIKESILPNAAQAFSTEAWMVGPLALTSSSTATALSWSRLRSFELEEPIRLLISSQSDWTVTLLQPALAKSRQNSRPKPDDAPVTITTLFSSRSHGSNTLATLVWLSILSFTKLFKLYFLLHVEMTEMPLSKCIYCQFGKRNYCSY